MANVVSTNPYLSGGFEPIRMECDRAHLTIEGEVPEGLDGSTIVRHMYSSYRTVIASQRTKLDNRVVRIGTMGFVGPADILADLHYLECTLRDLGRAPLAGAGVQAAATVLAR